MSEDYEEHAPQTPETTRTQDDTVSEKAASEKARKASDAFSAGQRKPKEMGMREMDQVSSGKTSIKKSMCIDLLICSMSQK